MKKTNTITSIPYSPSYLDRIWTFFNNPPTIKIAGISNLWLPGMFLIDTFLFLPMDLLLAGYCFKNKDEAYTTALFCALCSTVSALASYLIGFFAWEQIRGLLGFLVENQIFNKVILLYQKYHFQVVFVGSLLPIPIKSITISAGFCKLALLPFLGAILLARVLRFLAVAYIAKNYGKLALESLQSITGRKIAPFGIVIVLTKLGFTVCV